MEELVRGMRSCTQPSAHVNKDSRENDVKQAWVSCYGEILEIKENNFEMTEMNH